MLFQNAIITSPTRVFVLCIGEHSKTLKRKPISLQQDVAGCNSQLPLFERMAPILSIRGGPLRYTASARGPADAGIKHLGFLVRNSSIALSWFYVLAFIATSHDPDLAIASIHQLVHKFSQYLKPNAMPVRSLFFIECVVYVLILQGTWSSLSRLSRAWRYRVGDPWQMLSSVRYPSPVICSIVGLLMENLLLFSQYTS
jgi:hypothetical protein